VYQLILSLPGSDLHRTAIDLYRRHQDYGDGWCSICGERSPCTARRHAVVVIRAAGEDHRRYDEVPAAQDSTPIQPSVNEPWPSERRYPASAPPLRVPAEPAMILSEVVGSAISSRDVCLTSSFSPDDER
jgi:hypothetical protein